MTEEQRHAQIHGLYRQDVLEGIHCERCKRIADTADQFGQKREYEDVLFNNHGVKPAIIEGLAPTKTKPWWRRLHSA